jgi:hypothetical protein
VNLGTRIENCVIVCGKLFVGRSDINKYEVVDNESESENCCWDYAWSSVLCSLAFDQDHNIQISCIGLIRSEK